ncbi:uncharacterized protein LOC119546386 [Drosophila subpulchrella]|uniref:uncharacterized protein LOC119546386 n=1 Tax=Drosophila subpulchrella TaxID=1486046 RepID=UPI0018A1372E|nr:uncharacterized protein LOC119546386 [Drosophila subpulchrella]
MDGRLRTLTWLGCFFLFGLSTVAAEQKVFLNQNEEILNNILPLKTGITNPCDFKEYLIFYESSGFSRDFDEFISEKKMDAMWLTMLGKLRSQTYESGSVEEKFLKLYDVCNTTINNEQSVDLLAYVQPDINLPWPQYSHWPKERFQWLVTLARLTRYGMDDVLLKLRLTVDSEKASKYMVAIKKPKFLQTEGYATDRLAQKGFNDSRAEFIAEDISNLEKALKTLSENTTGSDFAQRLTLQQLENLHGISLRKYLEIVFDYPFSTSFQLQVNDVNYLVGLNHLINTFSQETVACFLMLRFEEHLLSLKPRGNCLDLLKKEMYFGGTLLLEEHVLGEKKVKDYQSQVRPIFKAIIKSFKKRLEKNRLNLPTSKIQAFQQFLKEITVNVGAMPNDKDHRLFVKDYYADLDFDGDDNLHIMLLKTSMLRTPRHLEKLDYTVTSYPRYTDIPNVVDFNTIHLPYTFLLEPLFMTRGHDVFKFNAIGVFLARQVFAAYQTSDADYNCQNFTNFLRSLDDLNIFTNNEKLCDDDENIKRKNLRYLDLVVLSLVHDAYFSTESGFDQSQPFFTDVPLKQLFILQFVQRFLHRSTLYHNFNNILVTMPAFAEAFNCSSSSQTVKGEKFLF